MGNPARRRSSRAIFWDNMITNKNGSITCVGFHKWGVSQNIGFIMENPIKKDDWGVSLFETPMSQQKKWKEIIACMLTRSHFRSWDIRVPAGVGVHAARSVSRNGG